MPTKQALEKELADCKAEIATLKEAATDGPTKKVKKPRAPSAYNKFVSAKFASIKDKMGDSFTAKAALTEIAGMWKTAAENPKNSA